MWERVNPSFDIIINAEQFAEDCREAQESPAKENAFRRYRLNQWTEQDVRWLAMDKWDASMSSSRRIRTKIGECCGFDCAIGRVFPYDGARFVIRVVEEGRR